MEGFDLTVRRGGFTTLIGPSGCGKTTLCASLLRRDKSLLRSVSATTRAPRKGERKNADYIYMTEQCFKSAVKKKEFLEHARVFGKHYGTPKKFAIDNLKKGKDVILCIDVQGAKQVKRAFKDAVLVFIVPPTFADLKKRLAKRSSDTEDEINKRLKIARTELQSVCKYNYLVTNDKVKQATDLLEAIILAERARV